MHVLLTRNPAIMPEYGGGLLRLAADLGDRLLPAFDTPTGIPLSWVNLRKVIVPRHDLLSDCNIAAITGLGGLLRRPFLSEIRCSTPGCLFS